MSEEEIKRCIRELIDRYTRVYSLPVNRPSPTELDDLSYGLGVVDGLKTVLRVIDWGYK